MKERNTTPKWLIPGAVAVLAAALVLFGMPRDAAEQPPAAQEADSVPALTVAENCELLQTLTYTRCEHTVTRRVTAPVELIGKDLEAISALYPEWQITEFAPTLIKMEQRPELFCPDHMVVMPGGAGLLCVFENKYGDALALVRELDIELSALPAAVQEEVQRGLGFSTAEELDMWLEGVES